MFERPSVYLILRILPTPPHPFFVEIIVVFVVLNNKGYQYITGLLFLFLKSMKKYLLRAKLLFRWNNVVIEGGNHDYDLF